MSNPQWRQAGRNDSGLQLDRETLIRETINQQNRISWATFAIAMFCCAATMFMIGRMTGEAPKYERVPGVVYQYVDEEDRYMMLYYEVYREIGEYDE